MYYDNNSNNQPWSEGVDNAKHWGYEPEPIAPIPESKEERIRKIQIWVSVILSCLVLILLLTGAMTNYISGLKSYDFIPFTVETAIGVVCGLFAFAAGAAPAVILIYYCLVFIGLFWDEDAVDSPIGNIPNTISVSALVFLLWVAIAGYLLHNCEREVYEGFVAKSGEIYFTLFFYIAVVMLFMVFKDKYLR